MDYVISSGTSITLSIDRRKNISRSDISLIFLKILIYVAHTYFVKPWLSVTGSAACALGSIVR